MIGTNPLSVGFNKVVGFFTVYDNTRHLVLFGSKKYDIIDNKVRYPYDFSRNCAKSQGWFICFFASGKNIEFG